MQCYLWVNSRKGRWDTTDMTRILHKLFAKYGVAPLGMQQWRQAAVSISDAHVKNVASLFRGYQDNNDSQDIMDIQRNHTTSTANFLYGDSSGCGIGRNLELAFMQASEAWQKYWGVSTGDTYLLTVLCIYVKREFFFFSDSFVHHRGIQL